jgi:glycosyltransferase involved in cell wall biosynthesis
MTSLVFVTQRIDEADPVLGFVPSLVGALAERFDAVTAIANATGAIPQCAPNVRVWSLGRERGLGRGARTARYVRLLVRAAREHRADALLAHMCPEYLDLAAPVAKVHGFPTLLWFAHPARSAALRIADVAADAVVTSLPGAYPLPSPKVHVIGQATDIRAFSPCLPGERVGALRALALGRTSPSKGFDVAIRAIAEARRRGTDVRLEIVGPSVTREETAHRSQLERLVVDLGLEGAVALRPGIPRSEIREVICGSDVLVNAMVAGSGDKVVFEAAALARPVIVSNPSFAQLLAGLPLAAAFPEGDHLALAERLAEVANADPDVVASTTSRLRDRVERDHSVDHWADEVVSLVERLRARPRRRQTATPRGSTPPGAPVAPGRGP